MSAQIVAHREVDVPGRIPRPGRLRPAAIVVVGYLAVVSSLVLAGLLLTHVLVDGMVGRWDTTSTRWLSEHRNGFLDAVTGLASRSADTFGILAVALVVLIVLGIRHRWAAMALLATSLTLELSAFLAVNALVDRNRPDVPRMGSTPSTGSFPSGHTAATLVLYGAIALFGSETGRAWVGRALAWVAAATVPLVVGFARVYRGFHHPTDVLFGYVLGCAVLVVAVLAVRTRFPTKTNEEILR
jgi:undecaprenyl-diphosphatase